MLLADPGGLEPYPSGLGADMSDLVAYRAGLGDLMADPSDLGTYLSGHGDLQADLGDLVDLGNL